MRDEVARWMRSRTAQAVEPLGPPLDSALPRTCAYCGVDQADIWEAVIVSRRSLGGAVSSGWMDPIEADLCGACADAVVTLGSVGRSSMLGLCLAQPGHPASQRRRGRRGSKLSASARCRVRSRPGRRGRTSMPRRCVPTFARWVCCERRRGGLGGAGGARGALFGRRPRRAAAIGLPGRRDRRPHRARGSSRGKPEVAGGDVRSSGHRGDRGGRAARHDRVLPVTPSWGARCALCGLPRRDRGGLASRLRALSDTARASALHKAIVPAEEEGWPHVAFALALCEACAAAEGLRGKGRDHE